MNRASDTGANRGYLDLPAMRLEFRRIPALRPGVTLVLLHEGLGCVALWGDFPDRLAAATGLGVFAYSREGYGRSSPVALPRPVAYMHREGLDVLPLVLAEAGIARAILVGHSDGGSIALIHAGSGAADRIVGVATLAAHVFNEDLSVASIRAAGEAWRTTDLRERLKRHHGDNVDGAFVGWNEVWLDPEFRHWNIEEYLPRIRVPVLAIQGADDQYGTEAQVDAIVRQAGAGGEKLMLPDCRHSPHRERPEETLAALKCFVDRLAPA
jgi:pimeloyl-ACP methyl ester carboxylesterase